MDLENKFYSVIAHGALLDQVYAMRYRSYRAENYIEPDSSARFSDQFDAQANCTSFLVYCGNEMVGSMRTCLYRPDSALTVPIMAVFDQEIRNSNGYDDVFVEINKFVIEPAFQRKGGLQIRFTLMAAVFEQILSHQAAAVYAAVRPEHMGFYKMFAGQCISAEKAYPKLNFKTVLMRSTGLDYANRILQRKLRRS